MMMAIAPAMGGASAFEVIGALAKTHLVASLPRSVAFRLQWPQEVHEYQTADGEAPLTEWLRGLRDGPARGRIATRLDRLKAGLLGDWKSVGGGKSTQAKDIETAHAYWKDYKARFPKPPVQSSGSPAKRGRGRRIP
jgi:putative component of toxin-antitoxin plasmid stabilization module